MFVIFLPQTAQAPCAGGRVESGNREKRVPEITKRLNFALIWSSP